MSFEDIEIQFQHIKCHSFDDNFVNLGVFSSCWDKMQVWHKNQRTRKEGIQSDEYEWCSQLSCTHSINNELWLE